MPSPRPSRRADRRPTWTSLILDALVRADDFMTLDALRAATGASSNQATATLHHLRNRHAAECLASDGQLFWYATPADDTRARRLDERLPEPEGNRHRAGGRGKTPRS